MLSLTSDRNRTGPGAVSRYFPNRKFGYLIAVAAFSLHLFLTNGFFSFDEVLNDSPLFNYDHPFHQVRSIDRVQYISEGGAIWGYNPRLMAGYADGFAPLNDGITHWINYLVQGHVSRYTVHKIWIMALLTLPVIMVPLATWLFGFGSLWLISMLLTLILLHSNFPIRNYYLIGMGPFVFANFISMLSVAAFYAYNNKKNWKYFLPVLFLLPTSFLFHPLSFVLEIVWYCVIFFITCRTYRIQEWIGIVLIVAVTILVNWHWIKVFLAFQYIGGTGGHHFFQSYPFRFFTDYDISDIRKLPTICITMAGLFGVWIMRHSPGFKTADGASLFQIFILSMMPLCLLPYFGGMMGLAWIQPYRFNISIPIFFLVPASFTLMFLFQGIRSDHLREGIKIAIFFLLICPFFGFFPFANNKHLTTDMPDEVGWMIEWLKQNTDKNARIALQEKGPKTPVGDSHFMSFAAAQADRELITTFHFRADTVIIYGAVTVDEKFIGIPFEELTPETLKDICGLYNIRTVILHDEVSKKIMGKLRPVAYSLAQYGQLEIFGISISPSFFLMGGGDLSADLNHIKIKNATAPETVIKYHYFELLKTRPELPLERWSVPNDPVGFIKVGNGDVREFEIYVDYD